MASHTSAWIPGASSAMKAISKGYEFDAGRFVAIDPMELKALAPKTRRVGKVPNRSRVTLPAPPAPPTPSARRLGDLSMCQLAGRARAPMAYCAFALKIRIISRRSL